MGDFYFGDIIELWRNAASIIFCCREKLDPVYFFLPCACSVDIQCAYELHSKLQRFSILMNQNAQNFRLKLITSNKRLFLAVKEDHCLRQKGIDIVLFDHKFLQETEGNRHENVEQCQIFTLWGQRIFRLPLLFDSTKETHTMQENFQAYVNFVFASPGGLVACVDSNDWSHYIWIHDFLESISTNEDWNVQKSAESLGPTELTVIVTFGKQFETLGKEVIMEYHDGICALDNCLLPEALPGTPEKSMMKLVANEAKNKATADRDSGQENGGGANTVGDELEDFKLGKSDEESQSENIGCAVSKEQGTADVAAAEQAKAKDLAEKRRRKIRVWALPAPAATLQYMLSVLKLADGEPRVLQALLPALNNKMLYLRNACVSRKKEVCALVQWSLQQYLPPLNFEEKSKEFGSKTEPTAREEEDDVEGSRAMRCPAHAVASSLGLFGEIARFFFRMNEPRACIEAVKLAQKVCHPSPETFLMLGRAYEVMGSSYISDAINSYQGAMELVTAVDDEQSDPTGKLSLNTRAKLEASAALERLFKKRNCRCAACTVGKGEVCNEDKGASEPLEPEQEEEDLSKDKAKRQGKLWKKLTALANKKSHEEAGHILLEENVPLAKSIIWDIQKKFYSLKGLSAWASGDDKRPDNVPFWITSNAFIANSFARVIFGYLMDLVDDSSIQKEEPIYLLELGAGHGKFSILFARFLRRRMLEAQKLGHPVANFKPVLVMTDFTESNVNGWKSIPEIQQLVAEGWIDYAVFDCERSSSLTLIEKNQEISVENPTANPIILLANYLFDSIETDAYRVGVEGTILEAQVTTHCIKPEFVKDGEVVPSSRVFQFIRRLWSYQPVVPEERYEDAQIAQLLREYAALLPIGSTFTFPTGTFRLISTVWRMVQTRQVIVLGADKGHNDLDSWKHKGDPAISVHGSISIMVNLDLVGRYIQSLGNEESTQDNGFALHSPLCSTSLDIMFAATGVPSTSVSRAHFLFLDSVHTFGVNELFVIRDHIEDVVKTKTNLNSDVPCDCDQPAEVFKSSQLSDNEEESSVLSTEVIVSLLRISSWDADLFWQFGKKLLESLAEDPQNPRVFHLLLFLKKNFSRIIEGYIPSFDRSNDIIRRINGVEQLIRQVAGS